MKNYESYLSDAYNAGVHAALEKISAVPTEVIGSLFNPLGGPALLPGLVIGALSGKYSKKEQKEADKAVLSSLLIPGVGPYRLGRRIMRKG